jgi:hypothetical protein
VVGLRVSMPVRRQTTQSAASIRRSAAAYTSGASSTIWSALAKNHSELILPPYLGSHAWPVRAAVSLILSASGWAAWCFQSLTHACGFARSSGSRHSGVPSAVVGSMVQAVKSTPRPITSAASTPDSRRTAGTVRWKTRR